MSIRNPLMDFRQIRLNFTAEIRNTINEAASISITDDRGNIIYVNKKFCDVSKYSKFELIGKNLKFFKSEFHSSEFFNNLWDTISSGKTWHGDIKNKAKDDTIYWLKTTITPTFNKNSKIENYIFVMTDITKQIELAEKLAISEQMAIIGKMSSCMTHDIRNPLYIIQMTLDKIKLSDDMDDDREKDFKKMNDAIKQINYRIKDVLDFVRKTPLKFNHMSLSKIISNSLSSLIVPSHIEIIYQNNNIELFCDERKISTVFTNLIHNSIQAITNTGTIEIITEINFDSIIIKIIDSGKGISDEAIDKIFEPLFTTKLKGTGLGLASVKAIIEEHGGSIDVTSKKDIGTTFTITIPNKIKEESPNTALIE